MDRQLGRELSRHEGSIRGGGMYWYLGGIFLLSGFAGIASTVKTGELSALAIAPIAWIIGGLILAGPILRWRQTMVVFQGGLVHDGLVRSTTLRAEQVRGIRLIHHRSKYGYRDELEIRLTDGSTQSFSGLKGSEQAAAFIHGWTTAGAPQGTTQEPPPSSGWQPPAQGTGWQPPGGA